MDDIENDIAAVRQIESLPTILEVVCQTSGMGFAAVARVTQSRWVACEVLDNIAFGLEAGGELPVETTICSEVRTARREVVFDNAAEDPIYSVHPTPKMYGLQSYISVPIILRNGELFGTVCAIDREPRKATAALPMMRLLAQLIAFHLDANQKLADSQSDLLEANAEADNAKVDLAASRALLLDIRENSEIREQFIAVLGHDLRNPLAALNAGRRMLSKDHEDAKTVRILRHMGESIDRMSGLIDNVMDFARGRLGGGIAVERTRGQRIEPLLAQVVNEIRSAHPERRIEANFNLSKPIDIDRSRFAQMFSNLLGNAITHGDTVQPIIVLADDDGEEFELSITNGGAPIPQKAMVHLFQPFQRGNLRPSLQGLGLGLYIANQIALAHGGRIEVTSDDVETRFVFRMPIGDAR